MSSLWNALPNFDGQTVVSLFVGSVLTLATFWFAYKKTLGAQDERARTAGQELILSVQRRVAVEREPISVGQFDEIRRAKSIRSSVSINRLLDFSDVLACVLADVVDNGFLESSSKTEIIHLINQSKNTGLALPSTPRMVEVEKNKQREKTIAILATLAAMVGIAGGFLAALIPFEAEHRLSEGLSSSSKKDLLFLVAILTATLIAAVATMIQLLSSRDRLRNLVVTRVSREKPEP